MTGKTAGFHIQLQTESNIEDGIFICEVKDGYDINALLDIQEGNENFGIGKFGIDKTSWICSKRFKVRKPPILPISTQQVLCVTDSAISGLYH